MEKKHFTLCACKFAMAGGIVGALCMFLMTLLAVYTGYGMYCARMMVNMFPGYQITLVGSLVGALYGFLKVFFTLLIFAVIYNKLLSCSKCCCSSEGCCKE